MFLIIGIPSIRLSEPVVDLSQRNIFVVILQACLRRQEYKRDPNEKKRDQFWGQETNFERSRFSSGSSSKQVLRTLGDTLFAAEGVCVCVCVCVSVCMMFKNFKGQGGEGGGNKDLRHNFEGIREIFARRIQFSREGVQPGGETDIHTVSVQSRGKTILAALAASVKERIGNAVRNAAFTGTFCNGASGEKHRKTDQLHGVIGTTEQLHA